MKLARKILALALTLCLMLPLTGCGEVVGRYRIVETLGEQSYAIGFRNDDYVRYYVEAALQELAADGTISGLANSWFIEDNTYFVSRSNALAQFEGIPSRTLLVGADPDAYPLSYQENGQFTGFDVELARAVCERLGFSSVFASTLAAMDKLAALQTLPDNEYDLKMMLSSMPEFDYGAAVRTLSLSDDRWQGQAELFDKLYRSGDPYRVGDLAITTGQLAVLGIRDKKAAWVVRQLLDTVIKTPELNQYPPLEMMALTLAQQYQ